MRRRLRLTRALALSSAWLAVLLAASCSETAEPRGGLMLVITKDGPLPLDRLEIQVKSGERTLLSQSYRLPEEAELPTTLSIVSNDNPTAAVKLAVVGWRGQEPLDRRDAIVTQVPVDRVAMLTVVLSGRCSSKVELDADGNAVSTCPGAQTCAPETGGCISSEIAAPALPTYSPGAETEAGLGGVATAVGGVPNTGEGGAAPSRAGDGTGGVASTPRAGEGGGGASSGGTGGGSGDGTGIGGEGEVGVAGTPSNAGAAGAAGAGPIDPCPGASVCDGFEDYATAQPAGPWAVATSGTNVKVAMDETRAYSGKRSVKLTMPGTSNYQRAFISLTGQPFPLANNQLYGRMMFYAAALPSNVHWTFVTGEGPVAAQGISNAMVRYGAFNNKLLMANYDAVPQGADCWQNSATAMPEAKWVCVEWQFDGTSNTQRLWLDGQSVADLTVAAKGQGCAVNTLQGNWYFPQNFERLYVGYESYQADAAARTVWIDDVAIDSKRLGCP